MGGMFTKGNDSPLTSVPTTKLEVKILETMRKRESEGTSMKSFNTIILKFPKIDAGLRKCKAIFEQFDEDKSGSIDPKELNHCLRKLEIDFTDEEINDIFEECDINKDMGIAFKEFIVLLCLVYLLKKGHPVSSWLIVWLLFVCFLLHVAKWVGWAELLFCSRSSLPTPLLVQNLLYSVEFVFTNELLVIFHMFDVFYTGWR